MSAAKESLKQFDVSGGTDAPENIMNIHSEASDKAITLMQRLSQETQAAVQEAQKTVRSSACGNQGHSQDVTGSGGSPLI